MADPAAFAKLVPGFDFLQGLMKNTGSKLPDMSQWIAPTLDPDELEKRIEQLRTVQFWLEQNARMLAATIQALEVQRMTLSTLKTMNLPVTDFAESLKLKTPSPSPAPRASAPAAAPADEPPRRKAGAARKSASDKSGAADAATPAGVVDPMQWWGALTRQFTELATQAMQEGQAAVQRVAPAGADAVATAASKSTSRPTSRKR